MFRRITLFLILNAAIILTISFLTNILAIRPYFTEAGIDYESLLAFCAVWGFTGSLISLALSRLMAKWMMGVELIDADTQDPIEKELLSTVALLAKRAGLQTAPEVGVYHSYEVNAFATGPSQSRSLVAVSTGLLKKMNWAEVEGVLGHEISHIANGDMVTMTLLQGTVNTFVMFFARILAFAITRVGKSKEESEELPSPFIYSILVFIFEFIFMILGTLIVTGFSRFREYRADAGSAYILGKEKMILALKRLNEIGNIRDPKAENSAFQSMKISTRQTVLHLFSSHPPLELRIKKLEEMEDV